MARAIAQHDTNARLGRDFEIGERRLNGIDGGGNLPPVVITTIEIDLACCRIDRHDGTQLFGQHRHQSCTPPVASRICPVTQRASSLISIITAPAISSG